MNKYNLLKLLGLCILLPVVGVEANADEGMWLFTNPPTELLKKKYNFAPTAKWLDHVQKSSVRFNNGGSGSFVSPNGLVMTNHHVALDAVQKISTKDNDYVTAGFYAKTPDEEVKAVDLELNVLQSIEDVTEKVKGAVKAGMSDSEAFAARRAAIAKIESESEKATGLRSDVVTLYQGGQYHLYRYKRYTDVRLVFAPEQQIAFFGGDADNFSYPRYCLDMAFFRVYEDGKPAKTPNYLKFSKGGPQKDELVFVSGHPGKTNRLNTVAELKYLRDVGYPFLLQRLYRWEVMSSVFSERSPEHARKAKDFLFGVANSRKAREGGLAGLMDPELMAKKAKYEAALRAKVNSDPKLKDILPAWELIEKAQVNRRNHIRNYVMFEAGAAFNTPLFRYARTLVRSADEFAKPNGDRLPEFSDANKQTLEFQLFSKQPIFQDFEIVKLADSLTWFAEQYGVESAVVKSVLAGKSPRARAAELVLGSKMNDPAARKSLYEGGKTTIAASKDPMIVLARMVDPLARDVRNKIETLVDEPSRQGYDLIAKAKFAAEGTNTYPDATFTLRLAYGVVKGYEEEGQKIPFETHFSGLYERAAEHNNVYPFNLPELWIKKKSDLDLKTPFNFVCTADIIGGNSGSPVINKDAEVVGLIFDGNIQSLVLDFAFTDNQARAVSVHSEGILEALRAVYQADRLLSEIVNARE